MKGHAGLESHDPEKRRAISSLGGSAAQARLTPEERAAKARKAGLASAAKRRAEREAAGIPHPRTRNGVRASADELEPFLAEIDAEGNGLTYEERIREAYLRLKASIARATFEALLERRRG